MMPASLPANALPPVTLDAAEARTSLWRDSWHRLKKNKMAVAGGIILIVMAVACGLASWIAPYSYETQDLSIRAAPPDAEHWLGTDALGRDQLTRLLYGGRVSLEVAFLATMVALIIGVAYGSISGFFGGRVDAAMMRLVDILYSLPFTVFVILLMVFFGRNIILLFLAIGAVEWLTMARVVRGQVQSLRKQEFIEAAHALGLSTPRIIFRHMIPNVLGVIIVYATLTVPRVILLESFLSFLGFGVQPPMSSWGTLIFDGSRSMEEYPWLLFFPALFFSTTLFSLNFLGDGLRDALDVRASKD